MFTMRRSSRKMLVLGALTLAAAVGPVAAAQAVAPSLTLTPAANTFVSQSNNVAASGTASVSGFVVAYAEAFVSSCAVNANTESMGDVVLVGSGADAVAAGPISLNLPWSPMFAASHVICGYLYAGGADVSTDPPLAKSADVTIVVKPADTDGDGVPNDVDACPTVAGTGPDGCPPATVTPVTPVTPVSAPTVPGGITPVINAPATNFDPTGVLKLKSSKGKATPCGAGCLVRTRTVGPFSFVLKVQVSGPKTKGTGSVTLTRKSAQAGTAGQVCLGRYTAKTGQICKPVKWTVGKKITVSGSITTPSAVGKAARQGFGLTAHVGQVFVGSGASVYLKSAGGRVKPDTNESACAASAGAHAAC